MSIICSNSAWNNSRRGCFGSLFARIGFPSFSSYFNSAWGILDHLLSTFIRFYAAFNGFSGSTTYKQLFERQTLRLMIDDAKIVDDETGFDDKADFSDSLVVK
jgi:hypothetical protein